MKKCPTCEKTFDDALRFCQTDGTMLVEMAETAEPAEPVDPYRTVLARPADIAPAAAAESPETPAVDSREPAESPSTEAATAKPAEEPSKVPDEPDPLRTMYVSEAEIRQEMAASEAPLEKPVMDIPPLPSEPPKFDEPRLSPPDFGDVAPPPSPFSAAESSSAEESQEEASDQISSEPIPPPFSDPKPPIFEPPSNIPQYKEAEPVVQAASNNPFNNPQPMQQAEWTPPPSPDPGWGNQPIGQNTPFQPPPTGAGGGQSQGLAIAALIVGIVSLLCCSYGFIVGIAAIVMGFIA